MTTTTFGCINSGQVRKWNTGLTYQQTHDAANADSVQNNVPDPYVDALGQQAWDGNITIDRMGLWFDTSAIPSNNIISSAYLRLYVGGDYSYQDFNIVIVQGDFAGATMVVGDYGNLLDEVTSLGELSTEGISLGYNNINLNALGLTQIVKAGTTKLGLRSSRDISATQPTTLELVTIASSSYEVKPELVVTYTPGPPTVITNAATGITPYVAYLNGTLTDDGGETCVCCFEWGTTTAYEYGDTAPQNWDTPPDRPFYQKVENLTIGTTYHFRAKATNSLFTGYGADAQFTTIGVPTVITDAASNVMAGQATLNGTLTDDGGMVAQCGFKWGETTAYEHGWTLTYGKETPPNQSYAHTISPLVANTTYHFIAVAYNDADIGYGADAQFTTLAATELSRTNGIKVGDTRSIASSLSRTDGIKIGAATSAQLEEIQQSIAFIIWLD